MSYLQVALKNENENIPSLIDLLMQPVGPIPTS